MARKVVSDTARIRALLGDSWVVDMVKSRPMKRMKDILRQWLGWAFWGGGLGLGGLLLARGWVLWSTHPYIAPSLEEVPARPVALVLGAGLWRDGSPTPVLRDRVAAAADLYLAGKVRKLLLSGDNRFVDYNEPGAMRQVALTLGVPDEDLVLDYAGRRTYDSCYRARAIFGVSQVVVVTQRFHLARAVYTCRALGLDAVGYPADRRIYPRGPYLYWNVRELLATFRALVDLYGVHPVPVLGHPEPVFPEVTP